MFVCDAWNRIQDLIRKGKGSVAELQPLLKYALREKEA